MTDTQLQKDPVKLYVQDIYRAKAIPNHKYIYELFGVQFKNIHIHGIVTEIYHSNNSSLHFELSDPTGTISVYYNYGKLSKIDAPTLKKLCTQVSKAPFSDNKKTIQLMKDTIVKQAWWYKDLKLGTYLHVVGDVFYDELMDLRNFAAFDLSTSSVEGEIIWLEELCGLYEKFYLWEKVD